MKSIIFAAMTVFSVAAMSQQPTDHRLCLKKEIQLTGYSRATLIGVCEFDGSFSMSLSLSGLLAGSQRRIEQSLITNLICASEARSPYDGTCFDVENKAGIVHIQTRIFHPVNELGTELRTLSNIHIVSDLSGKVDVRVNPAQ